MKTQTPVNNTIANMSDGEWYIAQSHLPYNEPTFGKQWPRRDNTEDAVRWSGFCAHLEHKRNELAEKKGTHFIIKSLPPYMMDIARRDANLRGWTIEFDH